VGAVLYECCICIILSGQNFLKEGGREALYTGSFHDVFAEVVWEGEWQSAQQGCRRRL